MIASEHGARPLGIRRNEHGRSESNQGVSLTTRVWRVERNPPSWFSLASLAPFQGANTHQLGTPRESSRHHSRRPGLFSRSGAAPRAQSSTERSVTMCDPFPRSLTSMSKRGAGQVGILLHRMRMPEESPKIMAKSL